MSFLSAIQRGREANFVSRLVPGALQRWRYHRFHVVRFLLCGQSDGK